MTIFFSNSGSFNVLEVSGSAILSGSLSVIGPAQFESAGITGSLYGTSSFSETSSYVEFVNVGNKPALVSSSLQVNTGSFSGSITTASFAVTASYIIPSGLPIGTVSSSVFSSPSQGTVRATINGVSTDVDTGLQTADTPSFSQLTLSGSTGVVLRTSGSVQVSGSISASAGITGSLEQFSPASLRITVSTVAPANPALYDLWVDLNDH